MPFLHEENDHVIEGNLRRATEDNYIDACQNQNTSYDLDFATVT